MAQPLAAVGRIGLEEFADKLAWSQDLINELIGSGRKVKLAVNKVQRRNLAFAAGFDLSERNIELSIKTKYRLYAVLVYTRGEVVKNPACEFCRKEETRVFPLCISMPLMGRNACAAHIWANKGSTCEFRM